MTALWIILAIALALTLLNLLPVGVDAAYAEEAFSLAARIGPARLHLLPKAPDAKPGKARTKKPKKKKARKKSAPPDAQTLLELAELGLQALDRLRQKLHVRLLRLDFDAERPRIDARIVCTIRIGQIVAVALIFGVGYLKQKLQAKKARAAREKTAPDTQERKVSNG